MRFIARGLVLILPLVILGSSADAAVKAGGSCTKVGTKSVSGGKSYTCIKSGKKLVWDKGVVVAKPSVAKPSPTPTVSVETGASIPVQMPTSFENLAENRKGIAYAAWLKTNQVMDKSDARIPPLRTFIGPNTKPWYTDVEKTMSAVSKAFPSAKLPANVLVLFYNFNDVSWAEEKLKTLISAQNYSELNRNEGGHLVDSNCQAEIKDCMGAKQVTAIEGTNLGILLIGVSNNPGMVTIGGGTRGDPGTFENNTTGQLLAHEYFHALQREEFVGKNLSRTDWPPRWVAEGSAYFIQNAVTNSGDFKKYANWRQIAVGDYIKQRGISADFVTDFMNLRHYADDWNSFSGDWNYFLGARIVETLVSLKGPESIMSFYKLMGEGKGFEFAFKSVYGTNYEDAVPVIAKAIAENWKSKD